MLDDPPVVRWRGRWAIVSSPDHVSVGNVGLLREQLLSVINRGATVLIVDMSGTASCDHSAVDALARAYQRAAASRTQLRLVVTAPMVRRVISIEGLDRLVSVYPTLEAATAAGVPEGGVLAHLTDRPGPDGQGSASLTAVRGTTGLTAVPGPAALTPAVLWQLIDALGDGLALLARGAIADQSHRVRELLDRVAHQLFQVGLSLQATEELPGEVAQQRIAQALDRLDVTIHEIRDYAFDSPDDGLLPRT